MEIEFSKGKIVFKKTLSNLDKFVIDFIEILNSVKIRYVIVSGYISILFGRSRATEDVDLFIGNLSKKKFDEFMETIKQENLWSINSTDNSELYSMLNDGLAIRIAENGKVIPNFELKFPKKDTDFFSLNNSIKVILNNNEILISTLEMHIAYKLYLGGEKDIEDAIHIYQLFKEKLDVNMLSSLIEKLNVRARADKYGIR